MSSDMDDEDMEELLQAEEGTLGSKSESGLEELLDESLDAEEDGDSGSETAYPIPPLSQPAESSGPLKRIGRVPKTDIQVKKQRLEADVVMQPDPVPVMQSTPRKGMKGHPAPPSSPISCVGMSLPASGPVIDEGANRLLLEKMIIARQQKE